MQYGENCGREVNIDYQLKGKLAYVSAGAHGIGQAAANLLAAEGASVIVADQDEGALREHGSAWAATFAADLATGAGIDQAVAFVLRTFGRAPDIVINNLGVGIAAPFTEISDQRWAESLNVNLLGTVRTCRALLPRMAQLGSAAIVNTGSDLSKQPEFTMVDYGAFKAALLYVTKALAKEYAPRVRINVVAPGPVWTRMWTRPGGMVDQLMEQYGVDKDTAVKRFLEDRHMPLGIAQPEDVANAIVFLASPLANAITGAVLDIGGTLRGLI